MVAVMEVKGLKLREGGEGFAELGIRYMLWPQ